VEVTLNALGERAGNTSLEEVAMALRTRPQHFPVYCDIDTRQIMRTSRMVASYTGIAIQANKAIVGANAFAHESGIHQHGVLAHAATYEIMTPESVGITGEGEEGGRGSLVLGKHSGKAAYRQRLTELGYADVAEDPAQLQKIVDGAKAVADKKKTITDQDLQALLSEGLYQQFDDTWVLDDLTVSSSSRGAGDQIQSTATVTIRSTTHDPLTGAPVKASVIEAATGVGPIDATFKAILKVAKKDVSLSLYNVTKIEGGSGPDNPGNDALASVTAHITPRTSAPATALPVDFPGHQGVTVRSAGDIALGVGKKEMVYTGNGTSTDIIVASARAYVNALNRMAHSEKQRAERNAKKEQEA